MSLGLYFWVTDIIVLGLAELIKGISWAMSWGIHAALLSEKASSRERPYVFGLSAFGFSLGAVIGYTMGALPTLLSLTFQMEISQSIRILYLVTAVIAVTSLLPLIPVNEKLRRPSRLHARIKMKWLNITSWRILGWVTFTNALIGLGAGFLIPLLSYYFTRKFSVNLGEIGLVFAVSQVGMAIASLMVPILSKKLGNVRTIAYLQGLSIPFLLLISVVPDFQVAAFSYVIRVILMNMANPVFSSFFMGTLKPEERASGNCIVWAIWNVGNALPLPIAGYIIDSVSLDLTLYVCALLYAVSTIVFYTIFKQQNKRKLLSRSSNF